MEEKRANIVLGIILAILMIIAILIVIINPNKTQKKAETIQNIQGEVNTEEQSNNNIEKNK